MDKWKTPVRRDEPEHPVLTVTYALACAVLGFSVPTAFAIWMGWLNPLFN
jgi:hypothetical protein